MIFIDKKKHNVEKNHIDVTNSYLSILRDTRDNIDSIYCGSKLAGDAVMLLDTNLEACMDLYRYCLCTALSLDCKLAYETLVPISTVVINMLKDKLQELDLLNKSIEYKQGFVEACMHCIVMSRNVARGV